jgi:diacylglycerol kinase family enzyme
MADPSVKCYFVVNPNAGTRREQEKISAGIVSACGGGGVDHQVYSTVRAGDGGDFMLRTVKAKFDECGGDAERMPEMRFYFAGGDGTVLESANAFMKLPEELRGGKVAVGIIPVGTGNDFLRNFGTEKDFLDISRQLKGSQTLVDLLEYDRTYTAGDGSEETVKSYCANMFNIGFDCQTVVKVNELRGRPYMTKKTAYSVGVALTLVKLPHTELKVTFDDGEVKEGRFLLSLAANGAYCGGGFYAASEASPDDGLIDVIIAKPMGRLKFVSMVGSYKKGKLLGTPKGDKLLYFRKCRSVIFTPKEETDLCVDGEIERFREIRVTALPEAFRFIVPEKD